MSQNATASHEQPQEKSLSPELQLEIAKFFLRTSAPILYGAPLKNIKLTVEEGEQLKQGKKPTRRQKELIANAGYNFNNWLVVKSLPNELQVVHRSTGTNRSIKF
ncbi:hypothetical protein LC040_12335 [Bacillus tianshenii]|nr:hypothetical protein LC040_12335 [Bacillus tianshenii]